MLLLLNPSACLLLDFGAVVFLRLFVEVHVFGLVVDVDDVAGVAVVLSHGYGCFVV